MKDENTYNRTGVVSAAVEAEREAWIKASAVEQERSVSWVVNKIMEMGWDGYFKAYPLRAEVRAA